MTIVIIFNIFICKLYIAVIGVCNTVVEQISCSAIIIHNDNLMVCQFVSATLFNINIIFTVIQCRTVFALCSTRKLNVTTCTIRFFQVKGSIFTKSRNNNFDICWCTAQCIVCGTIITAVKHYAHFTCINRKRCRIDICISGIIFVCTGFSLCHNLIFCIRCQSVETVCNNLTWIVFIIDRNACLPINCISTSVIQICNGNISC